MTIHWCVRTEHGPEQADQYVAMCGYESGVRKEFRFDSLVKVTCEECLKRYQI